MLNKVVAIVLAMMFLGIAVGCVVTPAPGRRPPPPSAPPPVPSAAAIDQRQRDLEYRIEQGFRSGLITRDEHQLLRRQADDIRRDERQFMNDGQLSVDERRALAAQLDRLAREVERQMKDADRR